MFGCLPDYVLVGRLLVCVFVCWLLLVVDGNCLVVGVVLISLSLLWLWM